jgi:hypothetical protein
VLPSLAFCLRFLCHNRCAFDGVVSAFVLPVIFVMYHFRELAKWKIHSSLLGSQIQRCAREGGRYFVGILGEVGKIYCLEMREGQPAADSCFPDAVISKTSKFKSLKPLFTLMMTPTFGLEGKLLPTSPYIPVFSISDTPILGYWHSQVRHIQVSSRRANTRPNRSETLFLQLCNSGASFSSSG